MCCIYGFQGIPGFGQDAGRPANRPFVRRQLLFPVSDNYFSRACCLTKKCYRTGRCHGAAARSAATAGGAIASPPWFFCFSRYLLGAVGKWETCFWFSTFPSALVAGAVEMWESGLLLARFPRGSWKEWEACFWLSTLSTTPAFPQLTPAWLRGRTRSMLVSTSAPLIRSTASNRRTGSIRLSRPAACPGIELRTPRSCREFPI